MGPSPTEHESTSSTASSIKTPPDKTGGVRTADKTKVDKALSNLNEGELKGLLDEAMSYKNPKDRFGKTNLFNILLNEAEEDERNARASRAGGSERVRYCNPSAKRGSRHHRKKQNSFNSCLSIAENRMHGGSLDNLASNQQGDDDEDEVRMKQNKKSVSARQKEGGSLPCNVNYSKYSFLSENDKKDNAKKSEEEEDERVCLLEHDVLAKEVLLLQQEKEMDCEMGVIQHAKPNSFEEEVQLENEKLCKRLLDENGNNAASSSATLNLTSLQNHASNSLVQSPSTLNNNNNSNSSNATTKMKKKKMTLSDKNVVVCDAEKVPGHRSDIINDVDKLTSFIENNNNNSSSGNNNNSGANLIESASLPAFGSNCAAMCAANLSNNLNNFNNNLLLRKTHAKNKQKDKQTAATMQKQHQQQNKLKKCNSMDEISKTVELEDFEMDNKLQEAKIVDAKEQQRRSWSISSSGSSNTTPTTTTTTKLMAESEETAANWLTASNSVENLIDYTSFEEFRVVTKKKKSKKQRRSSISNAPTTMTTTSNAVKMGGATHNRYNSSGKQLNNSTVANNVNKQRQRRKSACLSVPHSEKSNDDSDDDSSNDSVHSLPIIDNVKKCGAGVGGRAISYADMTRNVQQQQQQIVKDEEKKEEVKEAAAPVVQQLPPDVHNIKNFPAIKQVDKPKNNVVVKKAVVPQQQLKKFGSFNGETTTYSPPAAAGVQQQQMPLDIPDVQTIEKMQLMGAAAALAATINNNNLNKKSDMIDSVAGCELNNTIEKFNNQSNMKNNSENISSSNSANINNNNNSRTIIKEANSVANNNNFNNTNNNNNSRPAVVILSDNCNSREIFVPSDLIFGFDINEQLLMEDGGVDEELDGDGGGMEQDGGVGDFVARFMAPNDIYTCTSHNHDKIVNYIGAAWEDAVLNLMNNTTSGSNSVQYYSMSD